MLKVLFAEFLGTFGLVFMGTGAVIVNRQTDGVVTHCGVALVFGFAVLSMICCVGDVSGAHLNPAVTTAFAAARRFPWSRVGPYIAAQAAGAIAASGLLRALFPASVTLGETLPAGPVLQSFVLEAVFTFFLMLVIFGVSTGSKDRGLMAAIAIGAVVALEALFGGPVSGASMNPARSLGPALVGGRLEHLWIYIVAPCVGAWLAVPACGILHGADCCAIRGGDKTPGKLSE